jgi:uracil-DNA glycosylase
MDIFKTLREPTWQNIFEHSVPPETLAKLTDFLSDQQRLGKAIYPPQAQWFRALDDVPLQDVRVVILGQDPYHGPGQAQGLSFSVPDGMKLPPSLKNIFKELADDLSITNTSGDLSQWAEQGVLLLNAVLTVEASKAGSHAGQGWEVITDQVIQAVSNHCDSVVFFLWGSYAQKKSLLIDSEKHLILSSVHPSPLSAHRGFFGCKHFSQANQFFRKLGLTEINWSTGGSAQMNMF